MGTDPTSGHMEALYHPRTDRWQDHFTWSHDGLRVIGTTPTGRATIDMLALNRKGVVNLRRVLGEAAVDPADGSREEDGRE